MLLTMVAGDTLGSMRACRRRSLVLAPVYPGLCPVTWTEPKENPPVADLQKLFFQTRAQVTDKEILATARLNARVKAFAGRDLCDDIVERINKAVADEADQLVAEGVLPGRPDWLAVIVNRRLYVAFGSSAVQQLSRELKQMGAFE